MRISTGMKKNSLHTFLVQKTQFNLFQLAKKLQLYINFDVKNTYDNFTFFRKNIIQITWQYINRKIVFFYVFPDSKCMKKYFVLFLVSKLTSETLISENTIYYYCGHIKWHFTFCLEFRSRIFSQCCWMSFHWMHTNWNVRDVRTTTRLNYILWLFFSLFILCYRIITLEFWSNEFPNVTRKWSDETTNELAFNRSTKYTVSLRMYENLSIEYTYYHCFRWTVALSQILWSHLIVCCTFFVLNNLRLYVCLARQFFQIIFFVQYIWIGGLFFLKN